MLSLVNCRFCSSEIPIKASRNAFCNSECKRLYMTFGSYANWKGGVQMPRTSGSRKTSRKQGNTKADPKKTPVAAHSGSQGVTENPLMVPVQASNGKEYQQFILVMDYPEDDPPTLTGGSNLITTAGAPRRKGKQK